MGRRRTVPVLAIGTQINRWTTIGESQNINKVLFYPCRCVCGTERNVQAHDLVRSASKSCGCYQREHPSTLRHGYALKNGTRSEYNIWLGMKKRCRNPRCKTFKSYGGRGITVCARWNSFDLFISDVGPRPSTEHSLERINNDGNYEPSNVKWATRLEQGSNRRSSRYFTINGRTQTMAQWAREAGIDYYRVANRINALGWSIEKALHT